MLYEIINIRNIPDEEYRTAAALQPYELKKRLENCKDADIKRTLAGRILLFKMIKRLYGRDSFEIKYNPNGNAALRFLLHRYFPRCFAAGCRFG